MLHSGGQSLWTYVNHTPCSCPAVHAMLRLEIGTLLLIAALMAGMTKRHLGEHSRQMARHEVPAVHAMHAACAVHAMLQCNGQTGATW